MYAENLLGLHNDFLAPDIIRKFGDVLGETTEKTQKAIKAVIPTFLLAIINRAQSTDGVESLISVIQKDSFEGEQLDRCGDPLYLEMGDDAVRVIFGSKLNRISTKLEDQAGLKTVSIHKLFDLSAPLIMGALLKKIRRDSIGEAELIGYLYEQKLGVLNLVPETVASELEGVDEIKVRPVRSHLPLFAYKSPSRPSSWLMLTILGIVILSLVWWFTGKKYLSNLVQTFDETTPLSYSISPLRREFILFIQAKPLESLGSFHFDTILFNEGVSDLGWDSEKAMTVYAHMMMANPLVTLRLEGYTDNTNAEREIPSLSEWRAQVIKQKLVERGVDGSRILTLGHGPVDSLSLNATPEGRALNRRVDFVFLGTES